MRLRFPARLLFPVPRIPQPLPLAVVPQLEDEDSGVRGSQVSWASLFLPGIKTPAGVHTARETPACAGGGGEDHAGIFRRFLRHQSCTSRTRRTGILPASLHCETAARVTPRALRRSSVSRKTVGMRSSTFMARGCVTGPTVSSVLRIHENNVERMLDGVIVCAYLSFMP